jgi:hypothetical protein
MTVFSHLRVVVGSAGFHGGLRGECLRCRPSGLAGHEVMQNSERIIGQCRTGVFIAFSPLYRALIAGVFRCCPALRCNVLGGARMRPRGSRPVLHRPSFVPVAGSLPTAARS